MTTQTEALKLALEALESCDEGDWSTGHVIHPSYDEDAVKQAMIAIEEALAQPEQEPVAYVIEAKSLGAVALKLTKELPVGTQLYTTPQQHTWIGLTDEDVMSITFNFDVSSLSLVAKAVEAKLREKNT